jgi:hypothetical protein
LQAAATFFDVRANDKQLCIRGERGDTSEPMEKIIRFIRQCINPKIKVIPQKGGGVQLWRYWSADRREALT